MASFQAKIGWKRLRNSENKKLCFRSILTRGVIESSKKMAKKFNKLKNIIVASFISKIGWRRPQKRDEENYRSDPFLTDS